MEPLQKEVAAAVPEELTYLSCSPNLGMFELGEITFGLVQTGIVFQSVCKANREADLVRSLKIKGIL